MPEKLELKIKRGIDKGVDKIKISFFQFVGGILIVIGVIILIISSKLAYRPIGERAVK